MSTLTLYTTGTITFTNASAAITGVGTSFIGLQQGDPVLAPDGAWYELASAPSDNLSATLDRVYSGATATNSPGGNWVILRSSINRDSVRTATKQLTDISSVWRQIMSLTQSDQTTKLSKALSADRAGMVLQKALVDMFQVGTFQDDDFSIRYLLASTWTKALGVNPTTGATSFYSQILLGGVLSPTMLTATTNDYAPANLAQANILRVSTNAARVLTGLATGAPGRVLALMNVGTNELDLEDEGGSSAAANRFALAGNLAIPAGGAVLLIYDGVASRWRVLGGSSSGGTSGQKGWSPILAYVSDGAGGKVAQIIDWTGGEGTKPATGAYIGATGQVATAAEATSVLGPKGDQVQFRMSGAVLQWSYVGTINWQDLYTIDLIVGPPSALQWVFSTTTADADPGAGKIRFNNVTFGSVTTIFIDVTEHFGVDVSAYLDTWDDSSNSVKGTLTLIDPAAPQIAVFNITGMTTATGYRKLTVTPIVGGVFADTRLLSVQFARAGDKGLTATANVGTVSTLAPGADATVVNAGTANDAVFNFGIPQGPQGIQGIQGLKGDTGATYKGTSTTSVPVAAGAVTMTTQAGLAYLPGARVRASSTATPSTYLEGIISVYNVATGALTFTADKAVGTGTLASWNINLAGDPGSADFVTIRKFTYGTVANQTVLSGPDLFGRTLAYTPGYITVVVNGSTLTPFDFTATDGASVVLARAANVGDSVYIDCSLAYTPADALSISQNGADIANKQAFIANLGLNNPVRPNDLLNLIYQSKALAVSRRIAGMWADGYKATDGLAAGLSSNYAVNTSSGLVAPTTGTYTVQSPSAVNTTFTYATGAAPANLYDGSDSTNAADPGGGNASMVIAYDLGSAKPIRRVRAITGSSNGFTNAFTWNIQYSDTSLTAGWTTCGQITTAAGVSQAAQVDIAVDPGSHRYWRLAYASGTTGGNAWMGEVSFSTPALPANMTLVTTAQILDLATWPTIARALIEFDNSIIAVAGTDYTIELSCDSGAHWFSPSAYTTVTNLSQGGRAVIDTGDVTCTGGTQVQARIKTLTNKAMSIYGVGVAFR
jgi:hypothetical protein